MRIESFRFFYLFLALWADPTQLLAQLDTIHWIPPMYPEMAVGDQFIDLTTPEEVPFPVTILDGAGTFVQQVLVSNAQPFRYKLSDTYSQILVPDVLLQKILPAAGLVLHGSKPFHAGFRVFNETDGNACYLTCKGRSALGQTFRIGHLFQGTDKTGSRNNFIGIMATADETLVTLSGFDPLLEEMSPSPVIVTLQRGESIVYAHFIGGIFDEQPRNGFMGSLVTASKPVAVNCGSWLGAPVVYNANDIGADQILPLESVGKQYILCQGNGPTSLEHPIVVAHYNNTKVWINDEQTIPAKVLQAGEYFVLPYYYFLPTGNVYIRTSEPAFMYQEVGGINEGSSSLKTASLLFIPPINCGLPNTLNNIYMPNQMNAIRFDGRVIVVALRDSTVTVKLNGIPVDIGQPVDVRGNSDFVTYSAQIFGHTGTIKNMSIVSGGAMQAAIVERWKDASYAAFFSGQVQRRPEVHLSLTGDGICPDTLTATGNFDGIQWIYDDSLFQEGPASTFSVLAPGRYKAIAYLNGCSMTATTADSLLVPLAAPAFTYAVTLPSCFGFSDGQIVLGAPNGGTPPYQYSIDFGQHTSPDPDFDMVHAGNHKLVVLDASGCFNEPVRVNLGQPDSVYVKLFFRSVTRPIRPGDVITLEGTTNVPIVATSWNPTDSSDCPDCLTHQFRPKKSSWITLTVYDEGGCPGSDSLLVEVEPPVFAPNIFYPGADGGNDRFSLFSEKPLPVFQLSIYDRWGETVFERHDFLTNNPADGWDGIFRGKKVPTGVFFFLAKVEVEPGRIVLVKGDVLVAQ